MATTPEFGFRYPDGSENVDIPTGIQELAFDVEDTLYNEYLSKAGGSLTGALTVPYGIDGGIHIGGSGPRDMAGTGSPEGVVTAPVGSTWRDTNATTGAIKWIKATGTGSTGWRVSYGDTGWRALSTWDSAGVVSGWTLATGAAPVAGQAGYIKVRRVLQTVYWQISRLSVTSSNIYDNTTTSLIPTAFEISGVYGYAPIPAVGGALTAIGSSSARWLQVPSTATFGYSANAQWVTDAAWPSTLPGT